MYKPFDKTNPRDFNCCTHSSATANRRIFYVAVGACIGITLLIVWQNNTSNNSNVPTLYNASPLWIEELSNAFKCLQQTFNNGNSFQAAYQWYYLPEVTEKCSKPVADILNMETYNADEDKYFVPGPTPDSNYKLLTLGVGHTVSAEKLIMNAHPNCVRFVAVDPDPETNQQLVEGLGGKYLKHVIGVSDMVGNASLLGKTDYETVKTQMTGLTSVIKEAEMTDVIDLILMDIEGPEFAILIDMLENPEKYPVICQLNVELHSAFENGPEGSAIIDTLYKMTVQSRYLLLKVATYQYSKQVFNRSFFINVKDDYCVKMYTNKLYVKQ